MRAKKKNSQATVPSTTVVGTEKGQRGTKSALFFRKDRAKEQLNWGSSERKFGVSKEIRQGKREERLVEWYQTEAADSKKW